MAKLFHLNIFDTIEYIKNIIKGNIIEATRFNVSDNTIEICTDEFN